MSRVNGEKPKHKKETLIRLTKYIGRSRYILIALLVITLLISGIELCGPLLQGNAIDAIEPIYYNAESGEIIRTELLEEAEKAGVAVKTRYKVHFWGSDYEGREGHTGGMLPYLIAMGVLFLVSAVLNYFMGVVAAKLAQHTVYTMRNDLFEKISHLPIKYTDTHKHGDIMSRITNDVENISNAVSSSITLLFSGLLTIVGALVMMLILSPIMTLVAMITIPLSILISGKLTKFMRKYFRTRQQLLGAMNGTVEEMVTSYGTVVAYSKEQTAIEAFEGYSADYRDCSVKARVWGSIMGPIMNFLGNLQYVLVAATGGAMIIFGGPGNISIGNIQSMLSYSKSFTRPINQIANQYSAILTALAGAERIFAIMDHPNEVDDGGELLDLERMEGNISFCDVHFSYVEGEPVLRGFDLEVGRGQKIAIVGATGSGKTTVVNLLTRFYDPDSGVIAVDGVDITKIPKDDLRRSIAIVLQDTVLFRDTIRNNIKYGAENASDEEMMRAARHAKADVFIERLPDGYDTVLTEGGGNLSQGQRQLLTIARAVLADPKILILDEATSSVDTRTEMHIQQAMVALMKNRTSLIIAHRLSTIRDADTIVVLRDGVIAEAGNHDELLAKGGEYAKLYSNQFAGIAT
ncbi:MAG: ABC transporter ATP-binding protein [Clostridia bacterium]|nr:ABC transporter ATP-binding protein [Clostridia bacterium]